MSAIFRSKRSSFRKGEAEAPDGFSDGSGSSRCVANRGGRTPAICRGMRPLGSECRENCLSNRACRFLPDVSDKDFGPEPNFLRAFVTSGVSLKSQPLSVSLVSTTFGIAFGAVRGSGWDKFNRLTLLLLTKGCGGRGASAASWMSHILRFPVLELHGIRIYAFFVPRSLFTRVSLSIGELFWKLQFRPFRRVVTSYADILPSSLSLSVLLYKLSTEAFFKSASSSSSRSSLNVFCLVLAPDLQAELGSRKSSERVELLLRCVKSLLAWLT